jgi:hypothetical protein
MKAKRATDLARQSFYTMLAGDIEALRLKVAARKDALAPLVDHALTRARSAATMAARCDGGEACRRLRKPPPSSCAAT